MLQRIEVWKTIAGQFLDSQKRKQEDSYRKRLQITQTLAFMVKTLPARRVCPTVSPDEFLFFNTMLKETFPFESSPLVLQEFVHYFSEGITGINGFLRTEEREACYQGPFNKEGLNSAIEDMAWGLTSLSGRSDLPEVRTAALKEIKRIKEMFPSDSSGFNPAGIALKIFNAGEIIASTSFDTLREQMGNSLLENPFQKIEGDGIEIVAYVSKGCIFPIKWNPSFTSIALRFPHAREVTIQQTKEEKIIIDTEKVREWVVLKQNIQPPDLHEFYSISGLSPLKTEFPLLESDSRVPHPFKPNIHFFRN